MATPIVEYRIVIDRSTSMKVPVKPGGTVILELINERSFSVTLMRFNEGGFRSGSSQGIEQNASESREAHHLQGA